MADRKIVGACFGFAVVLEPAAGAFLHGLRAKGTPRLSRASEAVPRVSVVMTVRNLAPYVRESVESILAQSFRDFEFIIRDDGSDDGTTEILRSLQGRDPRISLQLGTVGLGPSASSNAVLAGAKGALVARMDGDDWSHPDRLRRQVEVLSGHAG